jgi:hypothetical protein
LSGEAETNYEPAIITFNNVNDMPILVNNKLTINEGQTVVLNNAMLSATDVDNNDATLTFTVNNVQYGQFKRSSNPGVAITTFTQQEIIDSEIQFIHDGSKEAPFYKVKVSDGELETEYYPVTIDFHSKLSTTNGASTNWAMVYPIALGVTAGLCCLISTATLVTVLTVGFFALKKHNKRQEIKDNQLTKENEENKENVELQEQEKQSQEKQPLPLNSPIMLFNQINQEKSETNEQKNDDQVQKQVLEMKKVVNL